ncbi:MAG: molecular chaperone TorD family protein [Rhodocyclaceae bacterium]|nr:molecular chaperone TorD family protein [Rhodocyclaceae bacterium]
MDARSLDPDSLRADLYLSLARAFLIPDDPAFFVALRDDLPLDLADLADSLGYEVAPEIEALRCRMAGIADQEALLQLYSRLFLQPPRAVHLNTGVYLDGALNGPSVLEMESWYAACGLARADDFHDLADHLAVQLECVGWLYTHALGGEALPYGPGQFLGRFVTRWAGALCADLETAERQLDLPPTPYLPLARLLCRAAFQDAQAQPILDPARTRREKALVTARRKQAEKGIGEADLAAIRHKLAERGLATDHLAIDPQQRDAARGWQRMTPPAPRRS